MTNFTPIIVKFFDGTYAIRRGDEDNYEFLDHGDVDVISGEPLWWHRQSPFFEDCVLDSVTQVQRAFARFHTPDETVTDYGIPFVTITLEDTQDV